jgi:MFS family permease
MMAAASVLARARTAFRGGPLAARNFRLLATGQLTSTVGDYCYAVALPWLVLSNHGSPALLGAVLACYGVPRAVFIPVGGVVADKVGPRLLMLGADTLRCGMVAVLVVLATQRLASLAVLGPVAALIGAGEGVFLPASMAIMPALVEPDQLQAANGISSALIEVGSLAGPVLGGALVALASPAPAFAVDAASFAVSAATLALITTRRAASPEPDAAAAGPTEAGTELTAMPGVEPFPLPAAAAAAVPNAELSAAPGADAAAAPNTEPSAAPTAETAGTPNALPSPASGAAAAAVAGSAPAGEQGVLSFLVHSRLLQIMLAVVVVANLTFGGTFEVALPDLAHVRFGAAGYGALLACLAAGGLIGTLTAARAGALRRPTVTAFGVFLVGGIAVCLLPLGGIVGAATAALVFGASIGFGNVVMITLIQRWAPARLLGRVMSLVMLASVGSFPVSVAAAGLLVRHLGPPPFFPLSGAVLALPVLAALTLREVRSFGVDAAAGRPSPEVPDDGQPACRPT